ncbi:Pr6Pr family membrane protein [Chitinophaga sp. G-6-1-13]|uniref:Pr6Pr family membrane protein n=1 Tax=Chitinophaga fulva TaxID=2728842 RepID=A0A848GVG6_9BACT|nr:Pr6Pr family membrane protein [Chitinophaga fulva]
MKRSRIYPAILSLLGWFALTAQYYLMVRNGTLPPGELTIRFFSYFTILTNLLVAICNTVLWLNPAVRFFSRAGTQTALTVYILVVGIIYNAVLRWLWQPQGLQWVVDELLHTVIPVLSLLYWGLYTAKRRLEWKQCWPWLLYPLLYFVYILARGAASGFYPYPFIEVNRIGITQALINALGIAGIFLLLSLLFISISRYLTSAQK